MEKTLLYNGKPAHKMTVLHWWSRSTFATPKNRFERKSPVVKRILPTKLDEQVPKLVEPGPHYITYSSHLIALEEWQGLILMIVTIKCKLTTFIGDQFFIFNLKTWGGLTAILTTTNILSFCKHCKKTANYSSAFFSIKCDYPPTFLATSSSRSSHFIGISDPKLMIMFAAKELSSYKVPLFSGILWHTEEVSYESEDKSKTNTTWPYMTHLKWPCMTQHHPR